MARRTAYRDKLTGQFVSRATWSRSKAHGGTRYVRSSLAPKPRPITEEEREQERLPRPERPPLVIDDFQELEDLLDEYEYDDIELGGGFDS